MIAQALSFAGRHARVILAGGCVLALFMPALSAFVRPALPFLVMLVLGVAMARIDMVDVLRSIGRPGFVLRQSLLIVLLMPVTAAVFVLIGDLVSLERSWLVYLAAAPPIASAAGLCFIMGYNARLALEASFFGALLTPILGPLTVALFLPGGEVLGPVELAARLAGMIGGAVIVGLAIRFLAGPERIARDKILFDGVAAVAMVLFVIPLFDGVGATILARPWLALVAILASFAFNMGVNLIVAAFARWRMGEADAGALGVIWGNRTIAMYLAALPPDPAFTLFVALYQFPMYFTPLILGRRQ